MLRQFSAYTSCVHILFRVGERERERKSGTERADSSILKPVCIEIFHRLLSDRLFQKHIIINKSTKAREDIGLIRRNVLPNCKCKQLKRERKRELLEVNQH